jgi:hypothetical protein
MNNEATQQPGIAALMDAEAAQRPVFMQPLAGDKVLNAVMRLAMEVCVIRDRLDATEAVLSEADPALLEKIEAFAPSAELDARRRERRELLVHRLLRDLG